MIRIRRYRIFLFFSLCLVFTLYYATNKKPWNSRRAILNRPPSQRNRGGSDVAGLPIPDSRQPDEGKQALWGDEDDAYLIEGVREQQEEAVLKEDFPQIELPGVAKTTSTSTDILKPTVPTERPPNNAEAVESSTTERRLILNPDPTSTSTSTTERLNTIPTEKAEKHAQPEVNEQVNIELSPTSSVAHWSPYPEHYPVPAASLKSYPTDSARTVPQIQHDFEPEPPNERIGREARREYVKETFLRHWNGYKQFAWEHDELKPVTGGFKDPFAGWRATLVDSLDLLWIMELTEEFEQAVAAVSKIDFTTTPKETLPLFEVTIRYLGGLLGAYDVSEQRYPVLLEKAKQLGEVLMSAFDTPNRMPLVYFNWRKSGDMMNAASRSTVLAEIGSLSMEFTRLFQLTNELKYYDAVARITDELDKFQNNTNLPGMWPLMMDASGGCATKWKTKASTSSSSSSISPTATAGKTINVGGKEESVNGLPLPKGPSAKDIIYGKGGSPLPPGVEHVVAAGNNMNAMNKRATDDDSYECPAYGLRSPFTLQRFTLGGQADSTYEYLPKEYLLLGGASDQYRVMHKKAMKTISEYLMFRPMIPDEERKLLFTGSFTSKGVVDEDTGKMEGFLNYDMEHLTCFQGAYIGLAAKIFDSKDDLDIAKQLTDGCVWAYEQTASGIMPENISPVPCETLTNKPCAWNESRWWDFIDPNAHHMIETNNEARAKQSADLVTQRPTVNDQPAVQTTVPDLNNLAKRQLEENPGNVLAETAKDSASQPLSGHETNGDQVAPVAPLAGVKDEVPNALNKQTDLGVPELDPLLVPHRTPHPPQAVGESQPAHGFIPAISDTEAPMPDPNGQHPSGNILHMGPPISQGLPDTVEEYVGSRIKDARLSPGIFKIGGRAYILRPEAIESVFYMYRITGDEKWREKAWKMFNAIDRATKTTYGNSAVHDVTVKQPELSDSAESFWTAETLKYFYLIWSEPSRISLDEWVFNTEAHPFKWQGVGSGIRPKNL